ncbi:MAG: cytochrome c oxidase subunit II [Gemmatimonadales bacterium]
MRRGAIVQLTLLALIVGGITTAVAVVPHWLPPTAAEQADRIDFVFWYVTIICIVIYAIFKFRAGPDDDLDGPPIHGNTRLEIVWTAVPAVLVTAISIVSAVVLAKNEHIPHASAASSDKLTPLVVDVTAQQFAWSFQYPGFGKLTSATLKLPIDVTTKLRITSLDVTHSFWVPEFSQKEDAVPGMVTTLVITPDRQGTFPVICTELCGLGHAVMRSAAEVTTSQKFLSWAKGQQKQLGSSSSGASGKAVFANNGCASCHTFTPAGAKGTVGPDLDKLPQEAQRAGKQLQQFIKESIVDPNAYVEPGFQKGIMPSTFSSLPKAQLAALVSFLAGGKK